MISHSAYLDFAEGVLQALFDSKNEEQTLSLGRKIGRNLSRGDVVAIKGELGAGKSVIVRGICQGLGISQRTRSPSFTFMNRYRGPVDVYHVDLYRIERTGELATLGWEDVLYSDSITIIEWADKLQSFLPSASLEISIEITGDETRRIALKANAERHEGIIEDILIHSRERDRD
jgi:tRNA threonylcarbamoyladenosine biosynthesis protein TsaE